MNHGSHMKSMLVVGAGLMVVLLVFGMPVQSAVFFAIALACPLMMVWMMATMTGQGSGRTRDVHSSQRDSERATSHPSSGDRPG